MKLFHKIIFWSHLLAGVSAGSVIFIMSFTGFVLMYERQLVEYAEREAREVTRPAANAQRMSLDHLIDQARVRNKDASPIGIILRNDASASVAVSFGRDGVTYVNPYTGEVLGVESQLHDWFHEVIDWHRWLGTDGENRAVGKAITGACNLAFFWLAVTGVFLWWPRSWTWRALKPSLLFDARLRGKARDWNWHNVIGLWSSGVLVVLTLSAVVMSYQWANDLLYTLTGNEPPPRAQAPAPQAQAQRQRRGPGGDNEPRERKPAVSFEAFFARAEQQAPGWNLMMIRMPQRGDGPVMVSIQEPTAPHIFARSQLTLDRANANLLKWEPYSKNNLGRKLRIWMRGLHTGEALGFAGQTVAGLASLGGCFLVWTGLAMAWRRFRYRNRQADDLPAVEQITEQAEILRTVIPPKPQIIETSQEAPRIDMEEANPTPANGYSRNGHEKAQPEWNMTLCNDDSVLILYGSVTGNAESLANKLAATLRRGGRVAARVRDMAHCQPTVLTQTSYLLMIASTYGDGEPPDDAVPFWQAVVHGNNLNLRGLRFSVLALGNTTFDQFCKCGRDFDAALERHGATRFYPRVDCDADYDSPARCWMESVVANLEQEKIATAAV